MWIAPACLIITGAALMLNSSRFDDDAPACYAGAALMIFGICMAIVRLVTPACYDGSLVGEALIRACG